MLCLEYPNGRRHELVVDAEVRLGDELMLFGHCWRVVGRETRGRAAKYAAPDSVGRLICRQVDGR